MPSPSSFLFMCVGCPSPPSLHPLTLSVYLCLSRWVCPPYLHLCMTFHPPCLLPEAPQAPPWRLPGAQVGVGDEAVCGDGFLGQEEACASPERGAILSQSHRANSRQSCPSTVWPGPSGGQRGGGHEPGSPGASLSQCRPLLLKGNQLTC